MWLKEAGLSLIKINRHPVCELCHRRGGGLAAGLSHWWLVPLIGDTPPMRLMLVAGRDVLGLAGRAGPGSVRDRAGAGRDRRGRRHAGRSDEPVDPARAVRIAGAADHPGVRGLHAQRRRAEQKEREYLRSEGRYRRLVEAAGEGIWAIDRDGRTTYANPRLGEILGMPSRRARSAGR